MLNEYIIIKSNNYLDYERKFITTNSKARENINNFCNALCRGVFLGNKVPQGKEQNNIIEYETELPTGNNLYYIPMLQYTVYEDKKVISFNKITQVKDKKKEDIIHFKSSLLNKL